MGIREIDCELVSAKVAALFENAAVFLPDDVKEAIISAEKNETDTRAALILGMLRENFEYAEESGTPICQDTGMAVVFLEVGQDVHITGGALEEAVNKGVRLGYARGFLRKSVVADPLRRINTGDNTPAVIHMRIIPGDGIKITALPKGFGSENMSALRMFNPSASENDIADFVADCVKRAGGQPCPPVIIGVGIGGTAEKACLMAKHALANDISAPNESGFYAALEQKILEKVNQTGVGPQGMGGHTTALRVLIEAYPTHIAGLPIAVNIGCHAARHMSARI